MSHTYTHASNTHIALISTRVLIFVFRFTTPTPQSVTILETPKFKTPLSSCPVRATCSTEQIFQFLPIGYTLTLPPTIEGGTRHDNSFPESSPAGRNHERRMYSVALQERMTHAETVPLDRWQQR